MIKDPIVTFVIPVLNSEDILEDSLVSIRNQNYPKDNVEIIIPDGGSVDCSIEISKKYKCKIIKNKKILAEPGFMLGAQQAKGELVVYMGADNRLSDENWIRNMVKPFSDPQIIGAYSWHKNNPQNTWLTKYFNTFTDPVNHFILGSACNSLYYYRNYSVLKRTTDYVVYSFNINNFPMLSFDQGFMTRKSYKRPSETEYDDTLPVLNLIKNNKQLAFVPKASNYHYTVEKGLPQYVRKMRWIIDNDISRDPNFGLPTRVKYLSLSRKIKFYLWPIYAASIVGPICYSIVGLLRDRKKEWLYHAPITIITVGLVLYEIVRLKVFRQKSLASRQ